MTTHTLTQKIILTIHSLTFFSTIFSPFFLSWETQIRYGYLISYGMTATVLGWMVFGRCLVSDLENSSKHGSIPTFLIVVMGININRYHRQLQSLIIYSSFLVKIYYAPTLTYIYFCVLLFFIYKMYKQFYCKS